jgi:hypothetical protein
MKNADIYSLIGKISIVIIGLSVVFAFANWVSRIDGFVFDPVLYIFLGIICFFLNSINQKLGGNTRSDLEEIFEPLEEIIEEMSPKKELLLTSNTKEPVKSLPKPKMLTTTRQEAVKTVTKAKLTSSRSPRSRDKKA